MPQHVQVDGIGTVEFGDEFSEAEISEQVGQLYDRQEQEHGEYRNEEATRTREGLTAAMADFPNRAESKRMTAAAQGEVAAEPAPDVYGTSPKTASKLVATTGGNLMAAIAKGLAQLSQYVPLGDQGDLEAQAAQFQERLKETPSQRRERTVQDPMYQFGDWMQGKAKAILESVPERERSSVAAQMTETVAGLTPIAAGPAAPIVFALLKTGEVYDTAYQDARDAGKSKDAAAQAAADKSLLSGAKEAAVWHFGPPALKKFIGDRILRTAGSSSASRWLAQTGAEGTIIGGTAAASTAAQNVIEGKPVGDRVGEEFVSGFVLPRLLNPRGLGPVGRREVPFAREVHAFLDHLTVQPPAKPGAPPTYTRPGEGPPSYHTAGGNETHPGEVAADRAGMTFSGETPIQVPGQTPLWDFRFKEPGVDMWSVVVPAGSSPDVIAKARDAKIEQIKAAGEWPEAPAPLPPVVAPPPAAGAPQRDVLAEASAEMERQRLANKAEVEQFEREKAERSKLPGDEPPPAQPPPIASPAPVDVPPGQAVFDTPEGPVVFDPKKITPAAVSAAVDAGTIGDLVETGAVTIDTRPPPAEPTNTNERTPGQSPSDPPRMDVREPTSVGPRTPPEAPAPAASGEQTPGGAAPGGPAEAGAGDQRGGSLPKRPADRAGTRRRPGDGGQPAGTPAAEGAGTDLPQVGGLTAAPPLTEEARSIADSNHVLPADADWIPSGDKAKVRANLDAIKLVKQLEAEQRRATPDEKETLAKYTGWGGLKEIFDEGKAAYRERAPWKEEQIREAANWEKSWGKLYDELNAALTPEERAAAGKSILNAHYTSREIINKMWQAVERLGFKGGRALEPAAGIGHFIGLMPAGLRAKTRWAGVEKDSLSGRIAQQLYPEAQIHQTGLEQTKIAPNSQDLVISNVPFAADGPLDQRYPKLSLHNYFFARALDLVQPGGLVAAITSDSTLDAPRSRAARDFFATKADLVGAIRLPNTAFKKNAGTEVTTDILFFRKHDTTAFAGAQPFQRVVPAETYKGEAIELNEYFVAHPEMMLGRMSREGTMYGPDQQALLPTPGADLSRQLDEAIAKLPANVLGTAAPTVATAGPTIVADKGSKLGGLILKDGVPLVAAGDGTLERPSWGNDSKKVKQAVAYVATRDRALELIRSQLSTETTDAEIATGRVALNTAYDAYVKAYGRINERKSGFLDDDVDFPLALALEDAQTRLVKLNGKDRRVTDWSKSKIFTERTLFPRLAPTHVDTVADGLQVSQNFQGRVDPDYIAQLTGRPVDSVKAELEATGQAFENPASGQWENRPTYLSGFVKRKLAEARAAAEADPRYKKHVAELEQVQPPPIAIENIGVKLGSVFVPPTVIEQFLRDKLDVDARVSFTPQTGDWSVSARRGETNSKNVTIHGIHDWKGHELVEQSLNLRSAVVTDLVPGSEPGKMVEQKNAGKSLEAQQKQSVLQKEFADYIKRSPEISAALEQIYNDKYNGVVAPKFDPPTWAHYPGASADIQLREHQKAVVTRMLQNSTLLAHAVGTGKTYAMTTAAMEMRRLGLAKKPMIVVQNATLEQFARSFKRLYPTARILSPNAKMRDATNRNKTMSRIATGDWDAVIVPQSFVNMLPDDPVRETNYIQDRLTELESAKIEAAHAEGKRSPKAADLQRAIDRLQTRLDALKDRKKDNVLTFEQLGVDALFVDEAHAYKKLEFSTKMENIKGLDTGASQRGWSMSMKTRWVQEKNQGRNVIFATGTPVSNTIAEAWNMMRYVRPDVLEAYDIEKFDDFASTFGDTVTKLELTPGGQWKPVTRFARYTNGPELIAAWRTVADVVTPEEIHLPGLPALKNGKPTIHTIPQSPAIANYVAHLRSELERFAAMSGKEKRDNSHIPLVVFGLAKKASLDMRMINPELADQPGSKLNVAADTIAQIHRDSTSVKGAQMVFSDAFQNNPDQPRFNLYQELQRKLIARGVPAGDIVIITSDIKDAKREALFTKLNDGDIRVAIGSTERMGIGVNAQEHLIGLHHLDAPPRPMDIEQRNGRILRQGNQNPTVEIHSYGVANTLDAAMFDKLATKQKFINQIMRGDLQGRNFEDAANEQSLTFEEQMAAFSGDRRAMEKVGLENHVRQIETLRSGHFEQQRKARETIAGLIERTIPYQTKALAEAQRRAAVFEGAFAPDKDYSLQVGKDQAYTGRKDVAAALDKIFKAGLARTTEFIRQQNLFGRSINLDLGKVKLDGQEIELTGVGYADEKGNIDPATTRILWKFTDGGQIGTVTSGAGFFHSLAASLERLAAEPKLNAGSLASEERNLRELQGFIQLPFEREAELAQSREKLGALMADLEAEGKAKLAGEVEHNMDSGEIESQLARLNADESGLLKQVMAAPRGRELDALQDQRTEIFTQQRELRRQLAKLKVPAYDAIKGIVTQGIGEKGYGMLPDDISEFVLFRGETEAPEIVAVKEVTADSSRISNSFYPVVELQLANGAKKWVQIRVSDHGQVSRNAPYDYSHDVRFTGRINSRGNEYTKALQKAIADELQPTVDEEWRAQREVIEKANAGVAPGAAGIKTRLESEADKGSVAALQPGRASALTGATTPEAGESVKGEVEHGFSGNTTLVQAAVKDLQGVRNLVAPQTAGGSARFAGNLLRELNAKLANELARADVALRRFRRDFDRTPINLRKFTYDPTVPLPRNFEFINAYESGNTAHLAAGDQAAAAELHRLNTADLARVHALGTGALTTFYANYFPHIWQDPKAAASVFGKILARTPLEGPKSFLKQRTHQLFVDGLAAGLKPVHDNPIDLWLLKKREIERFILAREFVGQPARYGINGLVSPATGLRSAGLLKFKYVFSKAPDGWATVDDSAFSVYGPPTVTVKEAFDAGMREATLDLLAKLGVPHERLTRIGGQRWGFERDMPGVPGSESITTKFAGPDFVIWHELGHVLHNRYADLQPTLTANDTLNSELRALADQRLDATSPTSFKRNVRSMPEKMAVVLQAYVHAPELMQRIAPTVKLALESFIAVHPELAPIKDIRPGLRLGVGEVELSHGGLLKLGDYVMPEAAARVVNNYLSPGLNPHLWYRTLRQTSNLLNGVQLGLSAFHLGFTSLDAATSRLSVALEDAAGGKIGKALATAATVPVSAFTNIRSGARLRAEVLRPGTHPEMAELAKALERAGGRVGLDAFWQTEFTRRMQRAWHEGGLQWATLPIRAPLAAWEQTMRPILEYIVPRQKLGVFADMAKRELIKLGPTANAETTREAMRKAWDSVDNRMGQVVYDNLFYNKSVKDVALLSFRAYGWQLGKYREGLGAIADTGAALGRLAKGQRPELSHRMAYAIALPVMVGTIGGLLHYLMTGQPPEEPRDYFQPRTGEVDANGNAVRLNLPSYVKDAIAYARHPLTSLGHSLNPLWSTMFDLLGNKDFYDVQIRNPDDPLLRQGGDVAEFAAKQFIPFSVSGAAKLREDAAPAWKQVAPFFGVTPVPQRLTMTPAQELAGEIMAAQMPSAPRTKEQFDRSKLIKEIVTEIKRGQPAPEWLASLAGGLDQRTLAPNTVEIMLDRLKYSPLQFQVSHFTPEAAVRVYILANAAERAQLQPILIAKIAHAKTLWPAEKVALVQKMISAPNAGPAAN